MNPTQFQCPAQTASGKSAYLRWTITSYSQSQSNNQTTIYWAVTIQGTRWTTLEAWSVDVAGHGGVNGSGGVRTPYVSRVTDWTVGQQISSGATTLNNASDGKGSWSFWMKQLFYYGYSSSRWNSTFAQTVSGTFTSPQIPRYPALTFNTVSSTLDTMTFGIGNSIPGTITSYQVQRVSDGVQVASGNISATSFSFTLTGLTPNTNYSGTYRVRAYANGGWGSWLTLTSSYAKTSALPTFTATDFDTGSGTKITLSRINDFNSYRVRIMNGSDIIIDKNSLTGSSNTITPSQNELNTILALMPNDVKKALTARVIITSSYGTYTLSDKTINISIPLYEYEPTFDLNKVSYADINPVSLALTGSSQKIIREVSNVKFTIQPATANGYSTMASYNVIAGTKSKNTSHTGSSVDITLDAVDGNGAIIQAIDSREKITHIGKIYSSYIEYVKPTLSSVSANRIGGVGENLLFNISGLFYNWTGLEQSNNIQSIEYRYREVGGSWSSYILIGGITYTGNQYNVINQQSSGNRFDAASEYQIELLVTDKLSSSSIILPIPSGEPLLWKDLENKLLGVGKKPDSTLPDYSLDLGGALQVNESLRINSGTNLTNTTIVDIIDNQYQMAMRFYQDGTNYRGSCLPLDHGFDTYNSTILTINGVGSGANFNDFIKSGIYTFNGTNTNSPYGSVDIIGILTVKQWSDFWLIQTYETVEEVPRTWKRTYGYSQTGWSWSPWIEYTPSANITEYTTTVITVTTSTTETTILEENISNGGTYLLTGSIMLNNYGIQTGREHFIRVYINNVEKFLALRVINSDVYSMTEALCLPFVIGDNQKIKITVKSGIEKQWSCNASSVKLLKIA